MTPEISSFYTVVNPVTKINKKSSMQLNCSKISQLFLINICPWERKKETNKGKKKKNRQQLFS
jgi:hypothetical protein